ncbi:MAG: hypothetical protein QG575_1531, partial [Euryarchaeota archaeon]|nr:hypothetical protein [Euryarchaeota archaeon]
MLGTFRKAKEIIRMLPVGFGLQILMTLGTSSNNDPYRISSYTHIEFPFVILNAFNSFLLWKIPSCSVLIPAA